jgi:3-oxoacyl-[acyl-carrier protein] reductase
MNDSQMFSERFAGRVFLITGGAQGMGRAIALRASAEGARVVLADIEAEKGEALAAELPGEAASVECDVRESAALEAAVALAKERFGGLDALFSCAGGALMPPAPVADLAEEAWDFLVDVNLKGQWLAARAAIPALRERGGGKIVGISSVNGLEGFPGLGAYASAKAGTMALTKTMAKELGPDGINVNTIAPAYIRVEHPKAVFTPDQFAALEQRSIDMQCVKRVGETPDIAAAALFLASDDAAFITGQVLAVDGGTTFQ